MFNEDFHTSRSKNQATKEYLGDGVYVDLHQDGALVLTTEDGIRITNQIVMDPSVCCALKEFVDRKAGSR